MEKTRDKLSQTGESAAQTTKQATASVANLAAETDPMPHLFMSGATAFASAFAYRTLNNPRAAMIAGGISALFAFAGYQLRQGNTRLGYDVGTSNYLV
jgi:hypothetical protein